jgi:hypothetical protein
VGRLSLRRHGDAWAGTTALSAAGPEEGHEAMAGRQHSASSAEFIRHVFTECFR